MNAAPGLLEISQLAVWAGGDVGEDCSPSPEAPGGYRHDTSVERLVGRQPDFGACNFKLPRYRLPRRLVRLDHAFPSFNALLINPVSRGGVELPEMWAAEVLLEVVFGSVDLVQKQIFRVVTCTTYVEHAAVGLRRK